MEKGPDLSASMLEATSCLLFVTEIGSGLVVTMNRAAEEITGFTRDLVIGLPLWDLAAPAHRSMLQRTLADPVGEGLPPSFESTVNLRSGKPRRIVWTSNFLVNADDSRSHLVITGIDMSSDAANGGLFAHLMGAANSTALISTDRRGRVTYCSTGAELLLGLHGADLVGQPLPLAWFDPSELQARASELDVPADLGVLRFAEVPQLVPASTGELLEERDWTLTRPDGRRLIASVAVSSARDAHGLLVGYVGVAHDVTERRKTNQVLADALVAREEAVERLHELDRAKSEFVATVSHELREPTASIVGCAEILQDGLAGDLNRAQRSLVSAVARSSERLTKLADDLVTLAEVDTGELEMERVTLDLRHVIWDARNTMQGLLLDRFLETNLVLSESPVLVCGDTALLTRVVVNLVSNAVKFTDDGGTISCQLSARDGDAVLEISDSGIGIPRIEQRDLFTRFFRSSSAQERATQGAGVGLSIVASIVHAHGGQIFVDSEHLEGCTFTVRIPLLALPATPLGTT